MEEGEENLCYISLSATSFQYLTESFRGEGERRGQQRGKWRNSHRRENFEGHRVGREGRRLERRRVK